ncbi:MAG: molecular chaperone DnaK [Chloroflexi bacterium]|nr:molecular chaperone DnaK [Chloroflexota bacterium]
MSVVLGIDLGTTFTVVATVESGRPRVIPNAEGQQLTPSVVAFSGEGMPLVGEPARKQAAANPRSTVFSIKRHMGSDYKVKVGGNEYAPEEISSFILAKVKADAESYLGQRVKQAVITVPAYFNERQREATKEAALLAGLNVMRIINEPTASALAYGLDREDIHTVLVWDLGGGTFDVSILDLGEGVFEVRAVSGDSWLGGDDYDQRLVEYLAQEYQRLQGVDFPRDGTGWRRLREAAEKAKIELSTGTTTRVCLPVDRPDGNRRHPEVNLTRERFQELTADLVERMVSPTRQALSDAGLEPEDIHRVILVGGATRMPAVREKARALLGKEPYRYIDPDEVVAMGAAIQAGVLLGTVKKVVLLDVIPLSLGIETQGGLFTRLIPRNTPLPASEARIFTTAADNQTSVDIHMLQGERDLALYNVSLGRFQLEGIPPLPRGRPKIEVGFQVDVDGIVHVSATDLLSESSESITVVSSKGLHREEMERMVEEASSHAEEDSRHRERVEAGIMAGNLISAAHTLLEQATGRRTEVLVKEVERGIRKTEKAMANGDINDMKMGGGELKELLRLLNEEIKRSPVR